MLVKLAKALSVVALVLTCFSSQASLIVNGDFESNNVAAGNWQWMSAINVPGWSGSNIEIWNNMNGVQAQSGNNFIELNAHGQNGTWSIFQTFATSVNQQYELSFFYRARNNGIEAFNVSVGDLTKTISHQIRDNWTLFTSTFIATDTSSTLRFTSLTPGTMGNFIDNVQVSTLTPTAQVTAPGTLALLLAGLGFFTSRRLRRKT